MKVLDLQCQHGHRFEGWFGSEEDYQSQQSRGLVECPLCGDKSVTKMLSAPRLNLGAGRDQAEFSTAPATKNSENAIDSIASKQISTVAAEPKDNIARGVAQDLAQHPDMQAAWLEMAHKVIALTEDVGNQFAQEARKIHYGDAKERGIRGQATQDETLELLDEGIHVQPLVLPKHLKGSLQ